MNNKEVLFIIKEIGRLKYKNNIKLCNFDCWFLFNITNRVNEAIVVTKDQERYLMQILITIKDNNYKKK